MNFLQSSQGSVRPYFIVRIGGLPISCAERLSAAQSQCYVERILDLDKKIAGIRDEVSASLYDLIGEENHPSLRLELVRLRRDLFNERLPSPESFGTATADMPVVPLTLVVAFRRLLETRTLALADLATAFQLELTQSRIALKDIATDADFMKALLLSSATLFANLDRYLKCDPAHPSSKDQQVEQGLVRYVTRMSRKATPFGTFCGIGPGYLTDGRSDEPSGFLGNPSTKVGHVRLNKNLFGIFWGHLRSRRNVRAFMHIELNPTLRRVNDDLFFLGLVRGIETFQRVSLDAPLNAVLDIVRSNGQPTLGGLIHSLESHVEIDATVEQAELYVGRLLQIGLIHFKCPVAEQEVDWSPPLVKFLEGVADEHAGIIADALVKLEGIRGEYELANVHQRKRASRALTELIDSTFVSLSIPTLKGRPALLYEDAAAKATLRLSPAKGIESALTELQLFVALTKGLAYPRTEQMTMRHFFDGRYSAPVSLMQFFEEFYRDHFKEHIEKERGVADGSISDYDVGNPFKLKAITDLRRAGHRIVRLFVDRWRQDPSAVEVRITAEEVKSIVARVPRVSGCRSASVFAQVAASQDGVSCARVIVHDGQYHLGYGKYFSRFLYLIGDDLQTQVCSDNEALTSDCLAEICADGFFNANLHPPLLSHEITYPTAEGDGGKGQISCSELQVAADPDDPGALVLQSIRTGVRVRPVDLGFMNPRMRPPLFQLLARFAPGGAFAVRAPASLSGSDGVESRPRLVFENAVVLARRRWTVAASAIPRRVASQSDVAFFLVLNRWRESFEIPVRTYVREVAEVAKSSPRNICEDLDSEDASASEKTRQHRRGASKPQYLDFSSPLLVQLLSRLAISSSGHRLAFEEVLPSDPELMTDGTEAYVSELVLQMDFPDVEPANSVIGQGLEPSGSERLLAAFA